MEQTLIEFFRKDPAEQMHLKNHAELSKVFPHLFKEWSERFPFDRAGLALTVAFEKSSEFRNGLNIHENFIEFSKKFWHLVTERPIHALKEEIHQVSSFHIHYYEASQNDLRGPHPLDMKAEVISRKKLEKKIEELLLRPTAFYSVLVHTSTGDDLYDHTYGAYWIGPVLPLDFSQLH